MDNKFTNFWKRYGPFFLIFSGITTIISTKNVPTGILFIVLGIILMLEND